MANNSDRKKLLDWLDKDLNETGGLTSLEDAQDYNVKQKLNLDPSFVALLWNQRSAKYYEQTPEEFLVQYVHAKFVAYQQGDKGARGDAVEAIVRFYLKRKFITYSDVMVQTADKVDIRSKNGRVEVGHNGKTFQSAYVPAGDKQSLTVENYMNGSFDIVVYGVFNPSFGEAELLNEERFLSSMKVFLNKYEFPLAIAGKHGLASGWNVAHERATVQYNASLQARFEAYCEQHHVLTLGEWLAQTAKH